MEFYGMTGERLGTIGEPAKSNEDLPQWKKDLVSKPSISQRKGIAWGYSPPYEDTSTLVLTSTKSGFVDVRFPDKPDPSVPLTSDPSFWAFTGVSSTTFLAGPDVSMPFSAHCVFNHEIDSRGPGISDEGDMFLLPNGDCIEVGMMLNPATGQTEMYKEYWTSPAAEAGSGGLKKTPCVVAKTMHSAADQQSRQNTGVIIRIGDHCQGILQNSSEFLVERWFRVALERSSVSSLSGSESADNAEWLKDWRSNTETDEQVDISIPSMWVCGNQREVGDSIVARDTTWQIVEVVR